MSSTPKLRRTFMCAFCSTLTLAGCGLQTPSMQSPLRPIDTDQLVVNIVAHVKNELRCTAYALKVNDTGYMVKAKIIKNLQWLDSAVAKVTLNLTVDEKTVIAPGLSDTTIYHNNVTTFAHGGNVTTGRSFILGLGGNFSAEANRKLSADYTFSVKDDLLQDEKALADNCNAMTGARNTPNAGLMIDGDLKLGEAFVALLTPNIINNPEKGEFVNTGAAPDTLQTDVTFTLELIGIDWTDVEAGADFLHARDNSASDRKSEFDRRGHRDDWTERVCY